ncbi:MAG: hypothetical protein FH751_02390 [Firmicutes bacterium]|nr:hypothetical protein [Bacillota bacterium]
MITQIQVKILKTIKTYIEKKGYSPSLDELKKEIPLKSKEDLNGQMKSLEKLGCIKKQQSLARSIIITDQGKSLLKLLSN